MSSKIFVGSLDFRIDDEALKEAFSVFGEVVEAKVIIDRQLERSRGFGFVSFATPEEAAAALEKGDGMAIMERPVTVKEAKERDPNAPRPNYQNNRPFNNNRGQYQNRRNDFNNGGEGYNNNNRFGGYNRNYDNNQGGFRRRNDYGYDNQQQGQYEQRQGQYDQQQQQGRYNNQPQDQYESQQGGDY
ncbi:hypothetical protein LPJ57_004132 [Coemansia sp. RSA 486]|nr:hypothetical protein LPJ57_004132 [Coemansia sp. RSA 486]KAJ2236907.1 hypothetical protein IWW45_001406 [Coemansia sp. RSA 485]KAJ2637542.1 hypothetical protein GGF40_002295 [Coemansia sp. RSA 1286]